MNIENMESDPTRIETRSASFAEGRSAWGADSEVGNLPEGQVSRFIVGPTRAVLEAVHLRKYFPLRNFNLFGRQTVVCGRGFLASTLSCSRTGSGGRKWQRQNHG